MRRKAAFIAFICALAVLCSSCADDAAAPHAGAAIETIDPHAGQVLVSDGMGGTMWVTDYENLGRNEYDTECLGRDGQYITYESEEHIAMRGIDVSFYQGEIDWQAVAADGVEFAIIRAGYRGSTEGVLNVDERFEENYTGAISAGLRVGLYFFSQAINEEEARQEAQFVLSLLNGRELDLPVFFDWEHVTLEGEEIRTVDIDGTTLTDCCLAFCEEIEAAGLSAGVYYYRSLAYTYYELDRLEGLTHWMACAGSTPDYYYDFDIWQYSFEGSVAGIDADTDLNLWFIPREDVAGEEIVETGEFGEETRDDAYLTSAALLYESYLAQTGAESYSNLNLSDAQLLEIAQILEENGLCAIDAAQMRALPSDGAVSAFAQSYSQGVPAVLEIYELCYDGGYLLHRLERDESSATITLTRVAWDGDTPYVTYSEQYPITAFEVNASSLYYEYYMADNPEGGNHDGHIDTEMSFRLS